MPFDTRTYVDVKNFYSFLEKGNLVNPAFTGAYKVLMNNDVAVANDLLNMMNSGDFPLQPFRLSKLKISSTQGKKENYTLCPDADILLNYPTEYGFHLLRNHTTCRARSFVAQRKILELRKKFGGRAKTKKLKDPLLWAYYIPYFNNRPQRGDKPENVIGYVDFHADNPVCPYIITGQMNGCHLIVSASPFKGYLRAWHYQSPGSNPVFTPQNFPFKVYAWLTADDYAGTRHGKDVCGFNFLCYYNGWRLVSQPQSIGPQTMDQTWGSYIAAASTEQLFSRQLNHAPFKVKVD
jgi:hypothetical protein